MVTVNTGSVIAEGCIIGAGSVVNRCSMCCEGVHVKCNATVTDNTLVPAGTIVNSGTVFERDTMDVTDLFFDAEKWRKNFDERNKLQKFKSMSDERYCFENGM